MKKKSVFSLLMCASLFLTACGTMQTGREETDNNVPEHIAEENTDENQSGSEKEVVMIYMVGSNLESEAGMASMDIEEIIESDFDEDNMDVLICTGGSSYWWIDGVSADECSIYEVNGESLTPVYTLNNKNMAEPATLTEFINYSYINYDAEYYSLIMWDHGGGAVLGFGADENYGYEALSLADMDSALKGTKLIADGNSFEWIGFDACLMGMIEVADVMSAYADYLIASEEVEAGEGWDYTCLRTMSDGEHFSGPLAANEIIHAYADYYDDNYNYAPDYTLSCLDLSKTDEVIASLEEMVEVATNELQQGGYSKIARLRDQSKTFGKVSSTSFYDTVDLYDLSIKMMQIYPEQSKALQSALEEMVVCETSNVFGAHGVAVYFPYENKTYAEEWIKEYETIGFSESYVAFLKSFTDTLSGNQLADWDISEAAPEENEAVTGEYFVQLTAEQYANYAHAKYSIWEEDSPGSYICWVNSSDVTVSEDGKVSSGFEGKRFMLGDTSGVSISCCAMEIERNESYAKYAIPIMITRVEEEIVLLMEPGYIHVKVDAEHPEGVVIGVYKDIDTDSSLFPDKDVIEIKEGDEIHPYYFARDIVFREDGSVAPFEEWESSSGTGDSIIVTGDFTISMEDPEETNEYCCLFSVTDTQGNSYYTNPIYLQY